MVHYSPLLKKWFIHWSNLLGREILLAFCQTHSLWPEDQQRQIIPPEMGAESVKMSLKSDASDH